MGAGTARGVITPLKFVTFVSRQIGPHTTAVDPKIMGPPLNPTNETGDGASGVKNTRKVSSPPALCTNRSHSKLGVGGNGQQGAEAAITLNCPNPETVMSAAVIVAMHDHEAVWQAVGATGTLRVISSWQRVGC
jgi:hypothetical protein